MAKRWECDVTSLFALWSEWRKQYKIRALHKITFKRWPKPTEPLQEPFHVYEQVGKENSHFRQWVLVPFLNACDAGPARVLRGALERTRSHRCRVGEDVMEEWTTIHRIYWPVQEHPFVESVTPHNETKR